MPKATVTIPHNLGAEEAKRRLAGGLVQARQQFAHSISHVEETWNGNCGLVSFRAMGFAVSAALKIEDTQALIEVQYPFAALPFKARIERELVQHTRQLLA